MPSLSLGQGPPPVQWVYSPVLSVTGMAYSPDGSRLAFVGPSGIQTYTLSTGVQTYFPTYERYSAVAFSPNGQTLYAVMNTGVEEWNVSTATLKTTLTPGAGLYVLSVAASSDGKTLAIGGDTYNTTYGQYVGVLQLWNVSTGKQTATLNTYAGEVWSLAFTPNGATLASGGSIPANNGNPSYGTLELWTVSTGKRIKLLSTTAGVVISVAFTPDGKTLADGGTNSAAGVLELWNTTTDDLISTLSTKTESVQTVTFTPDGKTLSDAGYTPNSTYEAGTSGVIEAWNLSTLKPESTYSAANFATVNAISYSPDGKTFVNAGANSNDSAGVVGIWEVLNGTEIGGANTAPAGYVYSTAFSPNGASVATGGVNTLVVWNTSTGKVIDSFPTSINEQVTGVAFSPDGTMLAASGANGTSSQGVIEIWNVSTGKLIRSLATAATAVNSIAFTPNGKSLIDGGYYYNSEDSEDSGVAEVWNVSNGSLAKRVGISASAVTAVACSSDGKTLAFGGYYQNYQTYQETGVLQLVNASSYAATTINTALTNVQSITFMSGGAAVVDGGPSSSNTLLESWTVSSGKQLFPPYQFPGGGHGEGGALSVPGLVTSSSESLLFAGTSQGLSVFSTSTFALLNSYSETKLTGLALAPTSANLALAVSQALVVAGNPYSDTIPLSGLTISPNSVTGGTSATGTVTLTKTAPVGGNVVSLSTNSVATGIPSTVVVAAGATTATFRITTSAAASVNTATITAASDGVSKTAMLTIEPAALVSVAVNPTSVQGSSSTAVTGMVTLSGPAPNVGVTVTLSSSNTNAATVPATVTVAAGQTTATFKVLHSKVAASTTVTIKATLASITKLATLTVTP